MTRQLLACCASALFLVACSESDNEVLIGPSPDGRRVMEVGYWRGEGLGIGGHFWIDLAPFQLEDKEISGSEFDLNRFKIHLPHDLNELNDKTIDCSSEEFSFGPNGSLQIRTAEGERIPLTPGTIQFQRTGNQSFDMKMTGEFDLDDGPLPFSLRSPLNLQFGYGAQEPHPNENTIDQAIELTGKTDLPRWCDETYQQSYDFEDWQQTYILLRPHRSEDFQEWKNAFVSMTDLTSVVLPQYEVPEWWPTKAHLTMSEPRETDVFFDERTFREDEDGNQVGYGLSVRFPAAPEPATEPKLGDLRALIAAPENLEVRSLESSLGWIAFRNETNHAGSIFIYQFERSPSVEAPPAE
ncbi:MAG: hypothetical protein AAF733_03435 [Verrucomicrobiota bacterium]